MGYRRPDVAADDASDLCAPLATGSRRQEERAVVRMLGPMTVVTAISGRPDGIVAARLIPERVTFRCLEHELADHWILVGDREAQPGIVRHTPDAGHALEASERGLQIAHERRAIGRIEDVDVAGTVIGDEARAAL